MPETAARPPGVPNSDRERGRYDCERHRASARPSFRRRGLRVRARPERVPAGHRGPARLVWGRRSRAARWLRSCSATRFSVGPHLRSGARGARGAARRGSRRCRWWTRGQAARRGPALALLDILHREHVEDLHRLAGIKRENDHVRESIESPPMRRARDRLPWLLVGLAGSMFAAFVMSRFEHVLRAEPGGLVLRAGDRVPRGCDRNADGSRRGARPLAVSSAAPPAAVASSSAPGC